MDVMYLIAAIFAFGCTLAFHWHFWKRSRNKDGASIVLLERCLAGLSVFLGWAGMPTAAATETTSCSITKGARLQAGV
eukprot:5996921-Amphidinium_carterae.1